MTERENRRMEQEHAGEHEAGQLTKQTQGLQQGETSAIAGPDWDAELVEDARTSMGGEPLEGELQRDEGRGEAS